jgi:hypothetical protein
VAWCAVEDEGGLIAMTLRGASFGGNIMYLYHGNRACMMMRKMMDLESDALCTSE